MTERTVALLGVPYDASSSFQRGSAHAPRVIREALWSEAGNSWTEGGIDLRTGGVEDAGDLVFEEGEPGEVARARIEAGAGQVAAGGSRPLILGGDHSITYPVLRGFRRHHQGLSVLHLDAHGDLYDEFQGDRYSHACPFARIMEEGLADRLVQVGIRSMTAHQREQGRRFGVETIEMKDWVDGRPLRFDTPVYLSFDLDVMEPGLAPGVSHREPGGLSVRQALGIIHSLEAPLVGADLVEFNPAADPTGLTAAVCAKLVKEIAGCMLRAFRASVVIGTLVSAPAAAQGAAPDPVAAIDFARLRDETAERLAEYLRIDTSNLPGNELASARWLKEVLARDGIEGRILDTAALGPGRANFYARLPGSGGGKAIALVHHMDVVPANRADWQVDPFGGVIEDGYVWGRGALDMKGHGIIQLMAMVALERAGVRLPRDLVYVSNADEEIGGLGSRTFVRDHPDLVRGIEYVLTEGADTRVENGKVRWFGIDVGEKRTWWKKMVARGTTSHGSVPLGDNPVDRLVAALHRIAAWRTPVRLTPAVARFFKAQSAGETGEHRAWLADAAAALRTRRGRAWLLGQPERNALLRNTITPTVLTGSSKTNIIPQEASAELDIRLLPDQDTVAFRRELERVIGDTAISLESIGDLAPPYDAPLDTELFQAIERVAGRMLPGVPVATPISAGASDRPYWAAAGPIAYGIDPWLVELEESRHSVHGNDERLSLANIEWGLRLYVGVLMEMQR